MNYPGINIQGNILSGEILDKIAMEEIKHQTPASFGLQQNETVRDEIGRAWSDAKGLWQTFNIRADRLKNDDSGTTETRNFWILPLLTILGYDIEKVNAEVIDGKTYAISHRGSKLDGFPVHITGINDSLDKRRESGGLRLSPHALVQEYLNKTEDHLYAIVTNGRHLRLLRDATRLVRLTYLEFDLEKIMEEELFADFALFYRLLHSSRMPKKSGEGEHAIIENYHQDSLDTGLRIRDKLREAVEYAIKELANGFLSHRANQAVRRQLVEGDISAEVFYQQLLRLIYRFLFLLVAEDRKMIYQDDISDVLKKKRKLYYDLYSIDRIRRMVPRKMFIDSSKEDLWEAVKVNFSLFEDGRMGEKLGIKPLGAGIFEPGVLASIQETQLENGVLLEVMQRLCYFQQEERKGLARVNYGDLDVEEFGSVYESLLELRPVITGVDMNRPRFGFSHGSERKTTGSYYTRHDLVAQLLKTALDPLIDERLKNLSSIKEKESALLSVSVCDPACGSGHFLLAAARKIALKLAQLQTGEENPGKEPLMHAMRQVIQHCIYGVDKNPAAVELCKVVLWIEGHSSGKPLSFLDHKIRPGDSLVGVDKLERLQEGIPDEAFVATTGDDKKVANYQKKLNRAFRKKRQMQLFAVQAKLDTQTRRFAREIRSVEELSGEDIREVREQKKRYNAFRANAGWWKTFTACNLFTYAFYQDYKEDKADDMYVTSELLGKYLSSLGSAHARLEAKATGAFTQTRYFHWPLEFPEITENGGFDLVLANPPWERIKLQEKEFFAERDAQVANAPNAAARKARISELSANNPDLLDEYHQALHESEAASKFIRGSGRYPLTGRGDINTYSIFSELIKDSISNQGAAGFVVPTGIATDDTNKHYFASLVEEGRLQSLFDFENRKAIFPGVHRSYKFALITLGAAKSGRAMQFGFFLHDVLDIADKRRVFALTPQDFLNINPNTKTTPVFRTRQDAELTAKIYSRVPVLVNEEKNQNPWGVKFMRMFDMSNDSHLFRTREQMEQEGFTLMGNRFVKGDEIYLPLYESKMIWHFDHRFGSYIGVSSRSSTHITRPDINDYQNPSYQILPWYWVDKREVEGLTEKKWFLGFRRITNNTNERTFVNCITGLAGFGDNVFLLFSKRSLTEKVLFQGFLSSLPYDYICRQKLAGMNMNFFYVQQFAVLHYKMFSGIILTEMLPKTIELLYNSWDIKAFADELWREADDALKAAIRKQWEDNQQATGGHVWELPEWAYAYPEIDWEPEKNGGCPLPPFKWDEERRALLRAELDAWYALLYGLERDELRYILDPKDIHGNDYPGESFRVLKEKEIRKYGEYRTRRLVLEAYDRLRPSWDMEAHLKKLKEVWEACQEDLSGSDLSFSLNTTNPPEEYKSQNGYGNLFDQTDS